MIDQSINWFNQSIQSIIDQSNYQSVNDQWLTGQSIDSIINQLINSIQSTNQSMIDSINQSDQIDQWLQSTNWLKNPTINDELIQRSTNHLVIDLPVNQSMIYWLINQSINWSIDQIDTINQSTNQLINWSIHWINHSINQWSMNQSINQSIYQLIDWSMIDQSIYQWMIDSIN